LYCIFGITLEIGVHKGDGRFREQTVEIVKYGYFFVEVSYVYSHQNVSENADKYDDHE
jgi:hypothetical protein